MSPKPTFNIILPVYNAESSIRACIDSILCQSYSDWRLLIMDDGSSDRTWEIITSCHDSRIEVFSQSNAGAYVARNNLIARANCQYLAFIDSDDTWMPNKLEEQLSIHRLGYEFVCTNAKINASNSRFGSVSFGRLNNLTGNIFSLADLLKHRANFIVQSSVSVDFAEFKKTGPFLEVKLAADFVQWLRILEKLPKRNFYYIDQCLCTYGIHEKNISADIVKKYISFELCMRHVMAEFDISSRELVEGKLLRNRFIIALKKKSLLQVFQLTVFNPRVAISVIKSRIKFLINLNL